MKYLSQENIWVSKHAYDDAESAYHENKAKVLLTPLAGEVAKARQRLIESRDTFTSHLQNLPSIDVEAIKFTEKKVVEIESVIQSILQQLKNLDERLAKIEKNAELVKPVHEIVVGNAPKKQTTSPKENDADDSDDVDLFGSDSEEENESAAKVREERLAAYTAKKSKKPALIAKSNIILDVKPWDDETDMKAMEQAVRKIVCDGLLWGSSKLVPLAFGIHKLQISTVVEDEKVSVDWLTEQIEAIEDFVQSVDIAAFNKI